MSTRPPAMRWPAKTLAGLALALVVCPSPADPMKPLAAGAAIDAGALPADAASAGANAATVPRLSATRSDASGRWQALLGTQWLRAGDRHDGARVLLVDANRLVLLREGQRDGRRETLYLLPPLSPARAAPGATPRLAAASAPPF